MAEKLFALDFPPGLVNNGTTFQSRDRWFVGNLVRFFQGTIQPVGGWVQRTLTGATITGTPNAAISWQTNAGDSYLAVGTSSNLYLVTSGNVVYDITPTTVVGDGLTHLWQLETFGTYLVATFARSAYVDTAVINAFVWQGVLATPAIPAYDSTTGPGAVYGCTVTPERFLVLLRGADPVAFTPDDSDGGGGASSGTGSDGSGSSGDGTGGGTAPASTPPTPTLNVTHPRSAVASWTNTSTTASIRVEWSIADDVSDPYVVDVTREKTPETATDTYINSDGPYVKVRVQYFNDTGAGAWGDYSTPAHITGAVWPL